MNIPLRVVSDAEPDVARFTFSDLTFDTVACRVFKGDKRIPLTDYEYKLLLFLASHVHQREAVTRIELNLHLGITEKPGSNSIAVFANRIRKKFRNYEVEAHLETAYGSGYRLMPKKPGVE